MGDVRPPSHLSVSSKRWFAEVVAAYELDTHHLKLLQGAAESWDECQWARRELKKTGRVFVDRFGQPRPRPELKIEADALSRFRLLLRELGLDVEEPSPSRGPRGRNY